MTIFGLILYTLLPFGQLWSRIFDYNGTVEMWWFFIPLFFIPPLQFIPVLFLYLGYIKNGKGGNVYDNYVWMPIITKLIINVVGKMIIPENYLFWISEIFVLISIIITKYLHTINSCKSANKEVSTSITKFNSTLIDSIFENSLASIFAIIFITLISIIPGLGLLLKILLEMEIINNIIIFIFWMVSYISIYTMQNMFEQSNMNDFCNPSNINLIKLAFGIIFMIINIIYSNMSFI